MKISELARLINYDYSAVSRLYHDKTTSIKTDMLDKICWALKTTPGELLSYTEI